MIQNKMFSTQKEKSFIDKLLGRQDIERIEKLIKKDDLTRSELLQLLYSVLGTESKLVNYGEWERYVILKFFVWIREFIKVAELLFDYEDDLKKDEQDGNITISSRSKQIFQNNKRIIQHDIKFLIDLYLNIVRTTVSLGGSGLFELMKNKYEVVYPQGGQEQAQTKKTSWFGA